MSALRPTARDVAWAGVGALAYPLGAIFARLLAHQSPLYPTVKEKSR